MRSPATAICLLLLATGCDSTVDRSIDDMAGTSIERVSCETLSDRDIEHVQIFASNGVAAGALTELPTSFVESSADLSTLPAFCRLEGRIAPTPASDIHFEIWLPEDWNGKFMQTGNGGAAGSIIYDSMIEPLLRGYAVTNTDTGHKGGPGDFSWAQDKPEKWVDYQYRAVHELTRVGKSLVELHYGRPPERNYFVGCSTGGRQALKQAQFFPDDYDGIVAGAPAANFIPLMSYSVLMKEHLGPEGLPVDKLGLLNRAAVEACDSADGALDDIISNYAQCDFDPAVLRCSGEITQACLLEHEVDAANRIYAGLATQKQDVLIPGMSVGSELEWIFLSYAFFDIGGSWYTNVLGENLTWRGNPEDAHRLVQKALAFDNGQGMAMDPDLSDFIESGARLILYHGAADGLIPFQNTQNYYRQVLETVGAESARDSIRFFPISGMGHCEGGAGVSQIGWLDALENWVEDDQAPDVLIGEHAARRSPEDTPANALRDTPFRRPVCAQPLRQVYTSGSDVWAEESFACVP